METRFPGVRTLREASATTLMSSCTAVNPARSLGLRFQVRDLY